MVNEVLQWVVIVCFGVLMLGLLRQAALQLPIEIRAAASGPDVGKRLPRGLLAEIKQSVPLLEAGQETVVAFVTESCRGCQHLIASLESNPEPDGLSVVLVAHEPSAQFRSALLGTNVPLIEDTSGEYWDACRVAATPLILMIDSQGRVISKEVTHRVEGEVKATA